MVLVLIFCFAVPISAVTVSENSTDNNYKIDDELEDIISNASDDESISVAMWLSDIDNEERSSLVSAEISSAETSGELTSDFANRTDLSVLGSETLSSEELSEQAQTLVELKRDVEKELHSENNASVISALSSSCDIDTEPIFVSNYAPLVIMEMTKDEIAQAVNNQSIESIYYYEPASLSEEEFEFESYNSILEDSNVSTADVSSTANSYPYGVWQNITNINVLRDAMGYTGSGIKIGLLENGAPNFDYDGISEDESIALYEQFDYHIDNSLLHFSDTEYTVNEDINHANYMLSILSGFTDDYEGVAPLAEIFCDGKDSNRHCFESIEGMLNNGVNIISASIYWKWNEFGNDYDYVSKYVDYVVSNSNVTMCFSVGNVLPGNPTNDVLSASCAYNVITVGNINDNNTLSKNDDVVQNSSLYCNLPNSVYKPDICAPGARVGTYVVPSKVTIGNGGSSAACPVVSGICALLMEAIPTLKTDPMLVKSLLMSSAYELDTTADIYSTATSIDPALTRECGSGMIDAYAAYMTYVNGNYHSYPSNYVNTYNYPVNVSQREYNAGKDIYISLNWEQWNTVNGENWGNETNYNVLNGFHHTLSLYDPNGVLVAVSDYQYDRKQFIRYKPLQTGRYTARITRSYTGAPAYYPQFAVAHCIK